MPGRRCPGNGANPDQSAATRALHLAPADMAGFVSGWRDDQFQPKGADHLQHGAEFRMAFG
jgi:hypothetical protein